MPLIQNITSSILNDTANSNFTICLDTSGSMYDSLSTIKQHIINFLRDISHKVQNNCHEEFNQFFYFNLIEFNNQITKWADKSVKLEDKTTILAINWLLNVTCGTGSELGEAINTAAKDPLCREIILISDAVAYDDSWTRFTHLQKPVHIVLISKIRSNEKTIKILKNWAINTNGSLRIAKLEELKICDRLPIIFKEDYSLDEKENNGMNKPNAVFDASLNHLKHLALHEQCYVSCDLNGLGSIYDTNKSINLINKSDNWQDYYLNNLLPGKTILVYRNVDGFFYKGTINSKVLDERFIVKYSELEKYHLDYEEVALKDIISLDDALLHTICEGDKVLAPINGLKGRYSPAIVLRGFEARNTVCNGKEDEALLVAFYFGKTKAIALNKAVWISDKLYEQLKYQSSKIISKLKYNQSYDKQKLNNHQVSPDYEKLTELIPGTKMTKEQLRSKVVKQLSDFYNIQESNTTKHHTHSCNKCLLEKAHHKNVYINKNDSLKFNNRHLCEYHNQTESKINQCMHTCCQCLEERQMERNNENNKSVDDDYNDDEMDSFSDDEVNFDLDEFEKNTFSKDIETNTDTPDIFENKNKKKGRETRQWKYWHNKPAPSLMDPLQIGRYRAGPYDDMGPPFPTNYIENIRSDDGDWKSPIFDVVPNKSSGLKPQSLSQSAFKSLTNSQPNFSNFKRSQSASHLNNRSMALQTTELPVYHSVQQDSHTSKLALLHASKVMNKEESRTLARKTEVVQRELAAQHRHAHNDEMNARRLQSLRNKQDAFERNNEAQLMKRAEKAAGYSHARSQAKEQFLQNNYEKILKADLKDELRLAAKRMNKENRVIDLASKALAADMRLQNKIW